MYRLVKSLGRGTFGAIKGAFAGALVWGTPLFMVDTAKGCFDIARGEPQEEIRINVGKVGDQEIIINHPYQFHYTKTIIPYVCVGLAGVGAVVEMRRKRKSLDDAIVD